MYSELSSKYIQALYIKAYKIQELSLKQPNWNLYNYLAPVSNLPISTWFYFTAPGRGRSVLSLTQTGRDSYGHLCWEACLTFHCPCLYTLTTCDTAQGPRLRLPTN